MAVFLTNGGLRGRSEFFRRFAQDGSLTFAPDRSPHPQLQIRSGATKRLRLFSFSLPFRPIVKSHSAACWLCERGSYVQSLTLWRRRRLAIDLAELALPGAFIVPPHPAHPLRHRYTMPSCIVATLGYLAPNGRFFAGQKSGRKKKKMFSPRRRSP